MSNEIDDLYRWRLILGKHAESGLGLTNNKEQSKTTGEEGSGQKTDTDESKTGSEKSTSPLDQAQRIQQYDELLDFLYDRDEDKSDANTANQFEWQVTEEIEELKDRFGTIDSKHLFTVPNWINKVREFFPKETVQVMTTDAIKRYHMTELLTDAEVLASVEPSMEMTKLLLSFKEYLNKDTLELAKTIIKRTVNELEEQLQTRVKNTIIGKRNQQSRSNLKISANFDFKQTIQRNLKHYDLENQRLVIERPIFNSRIKQEVTWQIIMAIDQSGSMMDSVIHSAVMGGIFSNIKTLKTDIVVFDTEVVNITHLAADPVELLFSVQLGGGTNIGKAVGYCNSLVETPERCIFILLTDFFEGADPATLFLQLQAMHEAGVQMIGLTALDPEGNPEYHKETAERCVDIGMPVMAITPIDLAEEVAKIIHS